MEHVISYFNAIFTLSIFEMKKYLSTKDYFYSKESFDLLYDEDLDILVTSPIPENLDYYYNSDEYISHTDGKRDLISKVYNCVKKNQLLKKAKLIEVHSSKGRRLLDVGAGTGDFLNIMNSRNWIVEGVEPSKQARAKAIAKGIQLNENLSSTITNKYDAITLWHVLEHLPNLKDDIKLLSNILDKDGVLIIALPNYRSWDAKEYQEHWAAYDCPRHLWHFSQQSIISLFKPYGLKLIAMKPMLYDAYYISLLSERYKTGTSNYLRAVLNGTRSNINGFFNKQYSSQIYILKR